MAGALVQFTTFPCGESKIHSKQSLIKMMYGSLQTPPMKVRSTFSGLRGVNMVNRAATSASRFVEMHMFERYTWNAERVIKFAQKEARRLGYNFVGPEMILLGLISDDIEKDILYGGEIIDITANVLYSMRIYLEDARAKVEEILGSGSRNVSFEIPFTPRAKRLLELALEESRNLGDNYIRPEHLLLGLLRVGGGVNLVIRNLGASQDEIRTKVMRMVDERAQVASGGSFEKKISILEEYGTDLTKLADEKKLDPVVGMQPQIEKVVHILERCAKNNPCLVGERGVGKTSIVEGLAQSIVDIDLPYRLRWKKVITVDTSLLVQGGFIKKLIEEIKESGEIILFIDNIHTIFGAEGGIGVANILKQALVSGELQCIGATTPNEYQKHMEKDSIWKKLFHPVKVSEPTVDETIKILLGLQEIYEYHHKVRYTHEALIAAAHMSNECISDRFLPGKAIDLIDEAGSFVSRKAEVVCSTYPLLQQELKQLTKLRLKTKEDIGACRYNDLEKAAMLFEQDLDCKIRMFEIEEKIKEIKNTTLLCPTVTKADIEAIARI